jgi:hypothetical protein
MRKKRASQIEAPLHGKVSTTFNLLGDNLSEDELLSEVLCTDNDGFSSPAT